VEDLSGSGHPGTLHGAAALAQGGAQGASALSLPGGDTDSAVRIALPPSPGNAFTFAAWVKPTLASERYFTGRTSTASTNGLAMSTHGNIIVHGKSVADGLPALVPGTWTHLAVVYNGAELIAYKNGLPSRRSPLSATATWSSDLWLGQEIDCANGCTNAAQSFGGLLDDVAWYDAVLDPRAVQNLFLGQSTLCRDGGPCTLDTCDPSTGCAHAASAALCDDKNPCTTDSCSAGGQCSHVHSGAQCGHDGQGPLLGGVWLETAAETEIVESIDAAMLQQLWQMGGFGGTQRLIDVEVRQPLQDAAPIFDILLQQGAGDSALWILPAGPFLNKVAELNVTSPTLRLVDVETFYLEGNRVILGVWNQHPGANAAQVALSLPLASLELDIQQRQVAGYHLQDLDVRLVEGVPSFDAVYVQGIGSRMFSWGSWDKVAAYHEANEGQLYDLEMLELSQGLVVYGVWGARIGDQRASGGLDAAAFAAQHAEWNQKGLKLIDLEKRIGEPTPPLPLAARLWKNLESKTMGYSYAVAKNSKPYGASAVGRAVAAWDSFGPVPMTPGSRVYLAGTSKIINALAYGALVDEADFDLDRSVYPWLQYSYGFISPSWKEVTFRELLQHQAGLYASQTLTACEEPLSSGVAQLLQQGLGPTEGGYTHSATCLMRVLLEQITGVAYLSWVSTRVLGEAAALDVTPERLGPGVATRYYAKDLFTIANPAVDTAGAGDFAASYATTASAFGFYGNARDLARLLTGFRAGQVVSAETRQELLLSEAGFFAVHTEAGVGYWHTGSGVIEPPWNGPELDMGCATVVLHLPHDVDMVLLINTAGFDALSLAMDSYGAWLESEGIPAKVISVSAPGYVQ
jgi:CubicO group peptidase (beta-lactamase class C family)